MKRTLNRWAAILSALCMAVLLLLPCTTALAGTTVIHVDTEEGGEVVMGTEAAWPGTPGNTKGTLFWNGSAWVSNDTAAHTYFTDLRTGERLLNYIDVAIPAAAGTQTQNGIGFAAEEYSYQVPAADGGGTYQYTGMKYTITQADGKKIILLSRGLGRGAGVSYLEAFMENPTSGTLAIRHGSALYGSAGTAAEAAAISNPSTGVMGLLRTADVYWFDMNGGSDMGGLTYSPHTDARPASLVAVSHPLLTNQVVRFDLMLMSTDNLLYRYTLVPALTSETFTPAAAGPTGGDASDPSAPHVTTTSVSGVTVSGATLAGRVVSTGASAVTARGFVIGTTPHPVLGGEGVINIPVSGSTGEFAGTVDSLLPNTAYYVRAYAVNSAGISYGEEIPFATGHVGDGKTAIPKTGDAATPWGFVLIGLAAVCTGCLMMRRRRT